MTKQVPEEFCLSPPDPFSCPFFFLYLLEAQACKLLKAPYHTGVASPRLLLPPFLGFFFIVRLGPDSQWHALPLGATLCLSQRSSQNRHAPTGEASEARPGVTSVSLAPLLFRHSAKHHLPHLSTAELPLSYSPEYLRHCVSWDIAWGHIDMQCGVGWNQCGGLSGVWQPVTVQ